MSHRPEGAAVADTTPEDPRDDSTLVVVALKSQMDGNVVKEGVTPGRVSLGWLRLKANADKWVEVDADTGKKVTAAQAAKAAAAQEG